MKRIKKQKHNYEVTVGNIGQVHEGTNAKEAIDCFVEYYNQSTEDYGRASGESVTLWRDGEPWQEHVGKMDMEA